MKPPRKLIVTGCARSGTTLLHSLMGYFKNVKVYRYAETLPSKFNSKFNEKFNAEPKSPGKEYIVIKRPQLHPDDERYFTLAELLEQDYRIINIIRDGRDVLVSRHPDDPKIYWVEPERWLAALGETLRHRESPDVLTLKYEELVRSPESCMGSIAEFLRTKYSSDYREFFRGESIQTYLDKAVMNGARPLNTSSLGNWRAEEHRPRIQDVMGERGDELRKMLQRLDYPAD